MTHKNLKDNIFTVKCDNCKKPFHYTVKSKSEKSKSNEPGEEEIVLNCPYCQAKLMVTVPRWAVEQETMYRGPARELHSRKVNS